MFNPFSEDSRGDDADAVLVERVRRGDREALERLVQRHQAWIYNIAVRMVFHPFLRPSDQVAWVRGLLERDEVRAALNLN